MQKNLLRKKRSGRSTPRSCHLEHSPKTCQLQTPDSEYKCCEHEQYSVMSCRNALEEYEYSYYSDEGYSYDYYNEISSAESYNDSDVGIQATVRIGITADGQVFLPDLAPSNHKTDKAVECKTQEDFTPCQPMITNHFHDHTCNHSCNHSCHHHCVVSDACCHHSAKEGCQPQPSCHGDSMHSGVYLRPYTVPCCIPDIKYNEPTVDNASQQMKPATHLLSNQILQDCTPKSAPGHRYQWVLPSSPPATRQAINIPVPLEQTVQMTLMFPKLQPKYLKKEIEVYLPRIIEVPYYVDDSTDGGFPIMNQQPTPNQLLQAEQFHHVWQTMRAEHNSGTKPRPMCMDKYSGIVQSAANLSRIWQIEHQSLHER